MLTVMSRIKNCKFDLEVQGQGHQFSIGVEDLASYKCPTNLMFLVQRFLSFASTVLSRAENCEFHLEGQVQGHPFSIGIEAFACYTCPPNFMILCTTVSELSYNGNVQSKKK